MIAVKLIATWPRRRIAGNMLGAVSIYHSLLGGKFIDTWLGMRRIGINWIGSRRRLQ